MTARCDCCDLPTEWCGKTRETEQRAEAAARRRRLLEQPGWFAARHSGTCEGCGEHFPIGTPIRSGTHHYVADCCEDT